jgi:hypothetical protein
MPLICEFFGIKIYMYWEDHSPPHFHARYNSFEIMVDIEKAVVLKGFFPAKELKLVLAWCELYRDELLTDWNLAKDARELIKISPLKK